MPPLPKRPLRLAVFAPLPPQASGIADYMRDLLPHLAALAEVDLYIDDYTADPEAVPATCAVYPHREFVWRRAEREYDCTVYHLGNSPYHYYLYPYTYLYPGVAVLHDQYLHHLIAGMAEEGRSGFYLREMAYAAGGAAVDLGFTIMAGQFPVPFFTYPLNNRVLNASLGVAVHSRYLADIIGAQAGDTPVGQIPMGIPLLPHPGEPAELRARLGLPTDAFIVGSFGVATRSKRIPQVLRAVRELAKGGGAVHYVVVGTVSPGYDLAAEVAELGMAEHVTVTGYVPEADYYAYLHAVDVCVNLRYPTAGETSAAALRSMASGRPTLVSNVGTYQELPDAACIKLPVGEHEVALLVRTLALLQQEPAVRRLVGDAGRAYVMREHSLSRVAQVFCQFVSRVLEPRHLLNPRADETQTAPLLLKEVADQLRRSGITAREAPLLRELAEALAFVEPDPPAQESTR